MESEIVFPCVRSDRHDIVLMIFERHNFETRVLNLVVV